MPIINLFLYSGKLIIHGIYKSILFKVIAKELYSDRKEFIHHMVNNDVSIIIVKKEKFFNKPSEIRII